MTAVIAQPSGSDVTVTDLFCGAGGSSQGARKGGAQVWRYRLFFAIGCILLVYTWLTLLSALWWRYCVYASGDRGIGLFCLN